MEELGVSSMGGRAIRLFQLSDWAWVNPQRSPFILFVAAQASASDDFQIRRFATDAIDSGCAYVCAWGDGCEAVHDLFDLASIRADRPVTSTWHVDDSLAQALYFALYDASPDDAEFLTAEEASIVLAVQKPWVPEVRRLVADQDELIRVVLDKNE